MLCAWISDVLKVTKPTCMQLFRKKYQKKGDTYDESFVKIRSYTILILLLLFSLLVIPLLVIIGYLPPVNMLWIPIVIIGMRSVARELWIAESVLYLKRYLFDKEFQEEHDRAHGLIDSEE